MKHNAEVSCTFTQLLLMMMCFITIVIVETRAVIHTGYHSLYDSIYLVEPIPDTPEQGSLVHPAIADDQGQCYPTELLPEHIPYLCCRIRKPLATCGF